MTALRKKLVFLLFTAALVLLAFPVPSRASNPFSDVNMDHWAFPSIQWGVKEGILKGYSNGSFKPDDPVTEAQFITMLSRYDYSAKNIANLPGDHFAEGNYRYFKNKNIPLLGYSNDSFRDQPITRGQVAIVMAAFHGYDLELLYAVNYMYVENLANGFTGKKDFQDYGADLSMTRAQAAAFFQRLAQTQKSRQMIGLEKKAWGEDNHQYELPLNFINDETVRFPPKKEDSGPLATRVFVQAIDIDKEKLIANGVDSTFVTVTLNDCYGNPIPYEESLRFRVSSKARAEIDSGQYHDEKSWNYNILSSSSSHRGFGWSGYVCEGDCSSI